MSDTLKAMREAVDRRKAERPAIVVALCADIVRLQGEVTELIAVARTAVAYDKAIRACANDPDKMASYCTAEGDTLDELYADWMTKANSALKKHGNVTP